MSRPEASTLIGILISVMVAVAIWAIPWDVQSGFRHWLFWSIVSASVTSTLWLVDLNFLDSSSFRCRLMIPLFIAICLLNTIFFVERPSAVNGVSGPPGLPGPMGERGLPGPPGTTSIVNDVQAKSEIDGLKAAVLRLETYSKRQARLLSVVSNIVTLQRVANSLPGQIDAYNKACIDSLSFHLPKDTTEWAIYHTKMVGGSPVMLARARIDALMKEAEVGPLNYTESSGVDFAAAAPNDDKIQDKEQQKAYRSGFWSCQATSIALGKVPGLIANKISVLLTDQKTAMTEMESGSP